MNARLRQSMSWLHTWLGLASGWVLYLMFVTGACGYYRHELTLWMTPELHELERDPPSDAVAARVAQAWLQREAPGATRWTIDLPDERSPALRVRAGDAGSASGEPAAILLDPRNGRRLVPAPRSTRGGDFLYRLHFDLHFISPILARIIVGLCAMVLLVTLTSGLIVHRPGFEDLLRFRLGAGRRAWLDAHNLTGLLALPFHVAVAYSGLVCLMILLFPWGILSVYGTAGLGAFARDSFPQPAAAIPSRSPGTLGRLDAMLTTAVHRWSNARGGQITVEYPNDRSSRVQITRASRGLLSYRKPGVIFGGVAESPIEAVNDTLSPVATLHSLIFGFHVGHFAGPIVRLTLFLLGLVGAAMVATGLVLWWNKRLVVHARGHTRRAVHLVDGLNAGVFCGLPLAMAAYLSANRLLPAEAANRASVEIAVFWWAWTGAIAIGLCWPTRWRWPTLFAGAGVALMLAPVVGMFTASMPLLAVPDVVNGINLVLVAAGLSGCLAGWLSRPKRGAARTVEPVDVLSR